MGIKSSSGEGSHSTSLWTWCALLAIATFAAYFPALRAGWIWDDDYHVTNNIQLRTLHGLREIWLRPGAVPQYYPLTHTSFWIEYHLWGLHPLGYHLDNILLQIANALLVGLVLRRLAVPGYMLAAAVFALHPVQVETVAWVTERKNLLSGLFYLSALFVSLDVWNLKAGSSRKGSKYFLCLFLFICALLCKTVTASLPVVILLLIWWKRRRVTGPEVAGVIPFLVLGAVIGSLTAWMEKHVVGAAGADWSFSPGQRVLIASRAVWFYLGKIVWPHRLMFFYPKWSIDMSSVAPWLYPLGVVAVLVALALACRCALVAALFFIVTLFPALGFVNTYPMRYSFVADHFQYLACIGPIALISSVIPRRFLGIPILLVLAVLTNMHVRAFADSETLWRDVISKDPRSTIAHVNLGNALLGRKDLDDAAVEFQTARRIAPRNLEAILGMGSLALAEGKSDLATGYFEQAKALAPENPLPYWNLGILLRAAGNASGAEGEFEQSARYLPNPAPAYEQLGESALGEGDLSRATGYFNTALQFDPDRVDTHDNLASVALSNSDLAAAREQCDAALAIDPEDTTALNNLGIVYLRSGQIDQAAASFRQALAIDPHFELARQNLARLGHN